MPLQPLSAHSESFASDEFQSAVLGALKAAREALAVYLENADRSETRDCLQEALRAAASEVAGIRSAEFTSALRDSVLSLIDEVSESGVHDSPGLAEDFILAGRYTERGPAGLAAAMLIVAAWQWTDAPALKTISPELAGAFVEWVFASPRGFSAPGQATEYPRSMLRHMEALLQLVEAQPESAKTRAALKSYWRKAKCIPFYFCEESLRRHYEVRARLLQRARVRPAMELLPKARAGRKLRVGIINRHFGPQTETYTTLPTFEQLDPERFEVLLFAHRANGSKLEEYAKRRAAAFHVLPEDAGEQVDLLRAAELDVAVFGTNVTAVFNEVARLALHRVAPLQVVNNSSCTTTGLPEIDLYVSGTLTETDRAAEHFSERLGLVAGPAHAFNYEADREGPTGVWTRAALGLPEDAIVFVTAANYFKITPEMQHAWAKLLAEVPGARLLVHPFNPNWSSSYPIKRFAAEFDRVLTEHGVATDRWVLSTVKFPTRNDVKELLRVGDVYLDTFPFGGVNSLVDPLEIGMPVVVWEGDVFRARMGGALLRAMNLEQLIATNEDDYLALAKDFAGDAHRRAEVGAMIADAMVRNPVFLDSLAASDAFGAVLEAAFDELCQVGREKFKSSRAPILATLQDDPMTVVNRGVEHFDRENFGEAATCARAVLGAHPAHPAARHLMGAVLLRAGQPMRAVDYFLGAVQHTDGNAPLWHDLAIALYESGRLPQAVQALETSLRIDEGRLDGWLLLGEMALSAGNEELLKDALDVARGLAPNDARVAGLIERAGMSVSPAGGGCQKHVLLYTDDPEHGGVAQYNHAILVALASDGLRVTCVQTESRSPLIESQREAGVRHIWIGYDTGREFGRAINDVATARRVFEAEKPDVVLFSDCCPLSNLGARQAAMEMGIPFVVVVGFVAPYLAQKFAAQVPLLAAQYRAAGGVVAVSGENLELLRQHFGLPLDSGAVIHYGRPERFFASKNAAVRARLRAELKLADEDVLCLTTARLAAVKGFEHQLRALAKLKGQVAFGKLHLAWAGDGDYRPKLEKECARLGLADRVHFLGHRWDVAEWYDAADIFVLPSHMEGMPLAIMEAMAKGLPVIATAVSGIPEELGDTGKLLPDPSKDTAATEASLAAALAELAMDSDLRVRLGENAGLRARELFREELMVRRTGELLTAVMTPFNQVAASAEATHVES